MIISLIRKNKKKHFSNYFTMYNSNIKKTWEGIRELVNVNKKKYRNIQMINHNNHPITNNKEMSNIFNEFYSQLGHNIEQKIPNSNKSFMSYLNSPINHTFELSPCSELEILEIISSFGNNKASGPNSIPTNLLKEFSAYFVEPLKLIIDKSLIEGTFPSILKSAHICPI